MKFLKFVSLGLAAVFKVVASQQCASNEFACDNGNCILEPYQCDGVNDCGDYSDEFNCTCDSDDFVCSNGVCIPGTSQCDFYIDCSDGSDEVACPCDEGNVEWVKSVKCISTTKSQFQCISDGKCLPNFFQCDGDVDCSDGSDEVDCPTPGPCIECADGGKCIPESFICDDWRDCDDASDEVNCPCAEDQVKCEDGRCINEVYWCDVDGVWDCEDGRRRTNCGKVTMSKGYNHRHRQGLPKLSNMAREGKISKTKYLHKMKTQEMRKLKK